MLHWLLVADGRLIGRRFGRWFAVKWTSWIEFISAALMSSASKRTDTHTQQSGAVELFQLSLINRRADGDQVNSRGRRDGRIDRHAKFLAGPCWKHVKDIIQLSRRTRPRPFPHTQKNNKYLRSNFLNSSSFYSSSSRSSFLFTSFFLCRQSLFIDWNCLLGGGGTLNAGRVTISIAVNMRFASKSKKFGAVPSRRPEMAPPPPLFQMTFSVIFGHFWSFSTS